MSNEGRICPQCGYGRQPKDLAPDYECPRCGIIYEKYVAPRPVPSEGENPQPPTLASSSMHLEPPAAAQPVLEEKEPKALEIARDLWGKGHPDEAIAELEKYLEEACDSRAAHLLLAEIYFDRKKPTKGLATKVPDKIKREKPLKVNPHAEKALFHASRARDLGGENDPATIAILADTLMQNGRPQEAVTLLEETAARNPEALGVWGPIIAQFRVRWALGTLWQFFNSAGKLLFESKDVEAIRKRLLRGNIPIHAKCRKNRVGTMTSLMESIGREEDRIHILFKPLLYHVKKGALWGACFFGAISAFAAGWWYVVTVFKEFMTPEYLDFFASNLVGMIASIVFFGWICLLIFVGILCLAMTVGGAAGALPGVIVGAPIGAIVGLLRWPFIPKLKASCSL